MLMTATITRIAHKDAPCGYAATVPKILAKSTCCDSQPLATDPRHECSQRVHNYGQKPRIAPSRSPKPLSRRGSLLPRTSENSYSTHWCENSLGGSSFSWLRGGPARAMGHWCENSPGG